MNERIGILAEVSLTKEPEKEETNVFKLLAKIDLDEFRNETQFDLSHPNWI